MKLSFSVLLFIALSLPINAQNTVAKFKYEDAEKAFYENKFEECIQLLTETETLLGQTAPNILHLRILAEHKLFETNPYGSYEMLDHLRTDCNNYLTIYDIAGLEEKYRDVYNIQKTLSAFPTTESAFNDIAKQLHLEAAIKAGEREKVWDENRKIIDSLLPMVFVEGGDFQMGLKDKEDLKWLERYLFTLFSDATPRHQVNVDTFKMAAFETTNKVWHWVMDGSESDDERYSESPVVTTWQDAQQFIKKLNQLTGRHYRLPTEAEWEFTARGGKLSKGFEYSGSDNKNKVSWNLANASFFSAKNPKLHDVGQKEPNELGIYDMTGNVWEWCHDWYSADYYKNSPLNNPKGPTKGSTHVARGGSAQCNDGCYTINRTFGIDVATNYIGFRLAMDK